MEFWHTLVSGKSGIAPIQSVDCSKLRFQNGAEVRGFDPLRYFDRKRVDFLDRFAQFGLVAARDALADARLELVGERSHRTVIATGCSLGGKITEDGGFLQLYAEGKQRFSPLIIPRSMASAAASQISMEFGVSGPAFNLSTACSSSAHAVGFAFWMVRHGVANAAIAGGSEAPFSLGNLKAWEAMRVLAPDTCRPFSRDRMGTILGEGAAMMVMEPLDAALERGAHIYGEITGFGMSADAHHLTQPSALGAARAMVQAMEDAGIHPCQVGYINAHGTGTLANDATEIKAIRKAFGGHAERLLVSSTKSAHGHTLGAAGAIECLVALLALRHGLIPPTVNFIEADPECDLDVVPNAARPKHVEYALSNSFAFGGLNAVLALRRWDGDTSQ